MKNPVTLQKDHSPIQVISVPVNLLYISIYRAKGRHNSRGCLMNERKLASYPGNLLARRWMERQLASMRTICCWESITFSCDTDFTTEQTISKHLLFFILQLQNMFQLMLYYPNWLGRFWLHFIYPYFFSNPPSYCTSQNTSFLVKAFGCSLFLCFHHRNVLPHSPLTPFLTEASSLFLHTAYILSYFSHFSSSALKNPTQCLLLNHLLILICQNLRH